MVNEKESAANEALKKVLGRYSVRASCASGPTTAAKFLAHCAMLNAIRTRQGPEAELRKIN
jgi:hypothetical protein